MLGFLLDGCGLFPRLFPRLGHAALPEVSTRQGLRCIGAGRSLALRQIHKRGLSPLSASGQVVVAMSCPAPCIKAV